MPKLSRSTSIWTINSRILRQMKNMALNWGNLEICKTSYLNRCLLLVLEVLLGPDFSFVVVACSDIFDETIATYKNLSSFWHRDAKIISSLIQLKNRPKEDDANQIWIFSCLKKVFFVEKSVKRLKCCLSVSFVISFVPIPHIKVAKIAKGSSSVLKS